MLTSAVTSSLTSNKMRNTVKPDPGQRTHSRKFYHMTSFTNPNGENTWNNVCEKHLYSMMSERRNTRQWDWNAPRGRLSYSMLVPCSSRRPTFFEPVRTVPMVPDLMPASSLLDGRWQFRSCPRRNGDEPVGGWTWTLQCMRAAEANEAKCGNRTTLLTPRLSHLTGGDTWVHLSSDSSTFKVADNDYRIIKLVSNLLGTWNS